MVLIQAKTMSTAHNAQEMLLLLGFLDRVTGSRHGWMIELYARCSGMEVRRLVRHVVSTLHYTADVSVGVPEALHVSVR